MNRERFAAHYGPWALVAGGSEGIGAAYAHGVAARGLNVLLVARREAPLEALAEKLRQQHHVEVKVLALDLGAADLPAQVAAIDALALDIGLLVYNAASSTIGPFLDKPLADHLHAVDVNCRGPIVLAHALGQKMVARGRGGIVLMSSLVGTQGSPFIASYAASKAFNLVLAEGLWHELGQRGVDVIACRPGATRTPAYEQSQPDYSGPTMEPGAVAEETLDALGKQPSVVTGGLNKLTAFFLGKLMSRKQVVRMMGNTTAKIYRLPS